MIKNIKFKKFISPSRFTIRDIEEIVSIASSRYEILYKELESKWEKEKLGELINKIDRHNVKIESGERSYLYDTLLGIEETNAIVEKEKKYFIESVNGLSPWSNKVVLKDRLNKQEIEIIPTTIREELELRDVQEITINFSNSFENEVKIVIGEEFASMNYFEIRGEDEEWVRSTKEKICEILEGREIPNPQRFLHDSFYQVIITLVIVFFSFMGFYNLYNVFEISQIIEKGVYITLISVVSVVIFVLFLKGLTQKFPRMELGEKKQKSPLLLTLFIFLLTNIIGYLLNKIISLFF